MLTTVHDGPMTTGVRVNDTDMVAIRKAMTRTPQIDPNEKNIPGGWPRAYYVEDGKRKYTQWSSARASDQIEVCNSDRLWTCMSKFACTSCGHIMEKGLILDRDWMNREMQARWPGGVDFQEGTGILPRVVNDFGQYDGHYGGGICRRCVVFAMKHCPFFSRFTTLFGDDLTFVEILDNGDYEEFDENGCVQLTKQGEARNRITLRKVRESAQAGDLAITSEGSYHNVVQRPRNSEGDMLWEPNKAKDAVG